MTASPVPARGPDGADSNGTGLADLAHDLQNALAAVKGHAEIVRLRLAAVPAADRTRLDRPLDAIVDAVDQALAVLAALAPEKPYYRRPPRPPAS
ncbi:MAG: hypothetical protein AVDCRST_MAG49-150 [uncultured Thermomicrobiales bacterium]|uniref:Signal transduction histidine kinase dimerisation/phosphoacceptor domain-containing protein n=1 Tax=uncultured Thermomicrobiales bacterium TaxID=1645740 RepID=A0A6J4TXM8_9BACT|nr:MAG: hypothetical protein AVDCRST_MAG49-150 [uncultured Thermomicrobiales bacterium]